MAGVHRDPLLVPPTVVRFGNDHDLGWIVEVVDEILEFEAREFVRVSARAVPGVDRVHGRPDVGPSGSECTMAVAPTRLQELYYAHWVCEVATLSIFIRGRTRRGPPAALYAMHYFMVADSAPDGVITCPKTAEANTETSSDRPAR